jgi:hypothetical protein
VSLCEISGYIDSSSFAKSKKAGRVTLGIANFSSLISLKKGWSKISRGFNRSLGEYTRTLLIKSTKFGSGLYF